MGKSHLQFNRDNKPGICYLKSVLGFWCNMSLFTAVNFLNIKLIIAWLVHKTWTFMFWCSLYQLNPKDSQKLFLGFSLTQNFAWREKYQLAGSENKILPPTIFLQSHFSSWGVQTSKFSLKAWHARSRDMQDTWHARHVTCTTRDMHDMWHARTCGLHVFPFWDNSSMNNNRTAVMCSILIRGNENMRTLLDV